MLFTAVQEEVARGGGSGEKHMVWRGCPMFFVVDSRGFAAPVLPWGFWLNLPSGTGWWLVRRKVRRTVSLSLASTEEKTAGDIRNYVSVGHGLTGSTGS